MNQQLPLELGCVVSYTHFPELGVAESCAIVCEARSIHTS